MSPGGASASQVERTPGKATLTSWVVGPLHSYTQEGLVDNNNMYSIALGSRFFKWKMLSLWGPNALLFLQLLIAHVTMSAVKVSAISIGFLLASLVSNRVSLEEECLPSFEVLNCLLGLAASCLDDENEIPLKEIVLVLDWTQCLPQGVALRQPCFRDARLASKKNWVAGPPERWELMDTIWLWVYSPFSDRVGLPLHNIPSTCLAVVEIFSVGLKFGHIRFYTLLTMSFLVFQSEFCLQL